MNLIVIRPARKISGAEIYNKYLLSQLARFKNVSVVMLTNSKAFVKLLRKEKIHSESFYIPVGEVGTKKDLLLLFLALPVYLAISLYEIRKFTIHKEKNIVVLNSMTEKILLTPILRFIGYKITWIEHGPVFSSRRSEIVKLFYSLSSKFADIIVAVSKDTLNDLVKNGIDEDRVKNIYIGVKVTSKAKKFKKRNFNIAFLGTVEEIKGINKFIDVAVALNKTDRYKFWVIGDGPLFHESKRRVKVLNLQKTFEFTGFITDTRKILQNIDVLFLPTDHEEGISIAILEALSQGVIVLTHDIGGNNEIIINNKTGFLYNKFNPQTQANLIRDITSDLSLMSSISKNSLEFIDSTFNIKKNCNKFYKMFSSL